MAQRTGDFAVRQSDGQPAPSWHFSRMTQSREIDKLTTELQGSNRSAGMIQAGPYAARSPGTKP